MGTVGTGSTGSGGGGCGIMMDEVARSSDGEGEGSTNAVEDASAAAAVDTSSTIVGSRSGEETTTLDSSPSDGEESKGTNCMNCIQYNHLVAVTSLGSTLMT